MNATQGGGLVIVGVLAFAVACPSPVLPPQVDAGPFVDRSEVPDDRPLRGLAFREARVDDVRLNFVVKSKIYAEDPNTLFLTLRGGGVSTYDVSVPLDPQPLGGWDSAEDVEGQDRRGELLVVVAREGKLLTFDVSDPSVLDLQAELVLNTDPSLVENVTNELFTLVGSGPFGALHTKLYEPFPGQSVALVTATATGELIAVDVTDPERPSQIGAVETGVEFIEGIFIHRGHAFVGGFGSSEVYKAVDVSDPEAMEVVARVDDAALRQMVSEMKDYHPDILYAALWNDEGGLGTFDVREPGEFRVLDRLLRPELAQSNRVKVLDNYAFLPLEQEPGGLAAVDVTDPQNLKLAGLARNLPLISKPYTLEINGAALYLFGTSEASMAIFEVKRGPRQTQFSRWRFGGDETVEQLAEGLAAEEGDAVLRFIDAQVGADEPTSTAAQTRFGSTAGIGHLTLAPAGAWLPSNGLVVEHGVADHFAGQVLQYTLVWDVRVPSEQFFPNGCFSGALALCATSALFQLDRTNTDDAELFVKVGATPAGPNGFVGELADGDGAEGLGGYGEGLVPDTWHRVALVVDLKTSPSSAELYVDGDEVWSSDRINFDRYAALAQTDEDAAGLLGRAQSFLLFADNSGEVETEIHLASLLVVDRAYSSEEVRALGAVGAAGIPAPDPTAD